MKLQTLKLTHYRGAEDLTLNLHPHLNVFIGVNGVGKSTILDSIAIMLSWVVNRIENPKASGRFIKEDDITNGTIYAIIEINSQVNQKTISWKLSQARQWMSLPSEISETNNLNNSDLSQIDSYIETISSKIQEETNLPLFVYYPVDRAVFKIRLRNLRIRDKEPLNILSAYEEALTSKANFETFFEWFREREDLENENFKYNKMAEEQDSFDDSQDKRPYPDPQLEAVRQAIYRTLPDFSNLTVERRPLRMKITKKGHKLTVNQLSDGEKCMIAMIGDLARRLAMANPENPDPLKGTGIVLIDEIDLHLHPQWQRFIVPKLLEVFENCQFFISTHSPHVITHVKPENLHLLELTEQGIQALPALESYGKTAERILEDLMGLDTTRPTEIDFAIRKIYEKISDNQLTEAQEEITQLKQEIQDDPALTKAEVLIRRKESIGK